MNPLRPSLRLGPLKGGQEGLKLKTCSSIVDIHSRGKSAIFWIFGQEVQQLSPRDQSEAVSVKIFSTLLN